ncbi:MAG: 30S ribosomal protein S4 [Thermoflexales bacterium]|nr:30S ribosomal protein S4 [Thermoflexales bacterium]
MARYTEPVCRLCRRQGEKLFLKGQRCLSSKCAIEKRGYAPGQHGPNARARRNKASDYSLQLREKQKVRRIYGLLEAQFRRYYEAALRSRGVTGVELLIALERRLDNTIYRAGFATSRQAARQLVTHQHFNVNGHPVDIASYQVKPGDKITVRDANRKLEYWKTLSGEKNEGNTPQWLTADKASLTALIQSLPTREAIELPIKEQLIVEYYSR